MKNSSLTTGLVSVLVVSVLTCAGLVAWYAFTVHQLRVADSEITVKTRNRQIMSSLANDAVEYSKQNRAIDPILIQFDLKAAPAGAPAPGRAPGR